LFNKNAGNIQSTLTCEKLIKTLRHSRIISKPGKKRKYFCPMLPDFRKSVAFWKVPRLHPFVLLAKSNMKMSVGHWWDNTDRGKLKYWGEKKPVPVPLCPQQTSHGLTCDRTQASAVRGGRLTA
jgi:hypothetical protein